jgi:RimJ/RimL family protein N-acetyltransferase
VLRRGRPADREPFGRLNASDTVMAFLGGPLDRGASDALVDRIEAQFDARGFGLWAVEVLGGPAFIGFVGLAVAEFPAPFTPAVEVGWRLAEEHWGRGYATEAARAALDFGFSTLDLDEIVSFTAVGNVRSRAVMERVGLVRDPGGDFDHPRVAEGSPLRAHVLYRARRDGWPP